MEDTRRRSAEEPADERLTKGSRKSWMLSERWLPVVIVGAALAAWEFAVRMGWLSPLFFPAPSAIGSTLIRTLMSGDLIAHTGATLLRLFLGLAAGGVPGLILGLMMGWSPRFRAAVDPLVAAAHPVPKIAILPLIMIIFGIGEASKVVVVAVAAFFPMLINAMAGVRQIHPIHFEVAKNYGASLLKVFARVVIPGSLPLVLTGMRLAFNVALLLTIAVELVTAQRGLGAMVWLAWQTLRTEELYVSIVVTAGLGISLNFALQRLSTRLVPWQEEHQI